MPQFKFNTISRTDIERSPGGKIMINAIDYNGPNHQIITGVPGSGKTTVTLMRAERLVKEGKQVKVFTYQNLLLISLRNISISEVSENMHSFYKWYKNTFEYLQPYHTEVEMMEKMKDLTRYDEILIDEGQDFEERIYRALLPKCTRMTVGADNAQKIYSNGLSSDKIELELGKSKTTNQVRLEYNYRNTFEIYNFSRHFVPYNLRANNNVTLNKMLKGVGNIPMVFQALNERESLNRLKILLEDAGDRNIAILCFRQDEVDNYYYKVRSVLGFKCSKFHGRYHSGSEIENILITTYNSAKGLEFQVVILPDMQKAMIDDDQTSEHYYVGCTRAKENLYLLFQGDNMPQCFNSFSRDSYEYFPATTSSPDIKNEDDLPF
jgi:superfamily I DNA/RNA helicase